MATVGINNGYFEVTLEGPVGRIMRAAREARQRKETLALADVSARLRAPTLRVSVSGRAQPERLLLPGATTSGDAQPPSATPVAPVATGVRLRSLGDRPTLIDPTIASSLRLRPGPFESEFDLAAFRGLGDPVEVIVLGGMPGESRCRLSGRTLTQVR